MAFSLSKYSGSRSMTPSDQSYEAMEEDEGETRRMAMNQKEEYQ